MENETININLSNIPSYLAETVGDMKNMGISEEIAAHVEETLSKFVSSLNKMSEAISTFKIHYNTYVNMTITDTEILKQQMKERVVRVMNNDI